MKKEVIYIPLSQIRLDPDLDSAVGRKRRGIRRGG